MLSWMTLVYFRPKLRHQVHSGATMKLGSADSDALKIPARRAEYLRLRAPFLHFTLNQHNMTTARQVTNNPATDGVGFSLCIKSYRTPFCARRITSSRDTRRPARP
jgi:hypothetical protein